MATDQIFPVVLARDAGATVEFTLESLRDFPEVIVYAWGSRSRTRTICRRYPNTHFIDGDFLGCGRTRNRAGGLAEGDWILALDADEYLSDALRASLKGLRLANPATAYSLRRHNLFLDKDIRWAGWGNEWSIRLYNRLAYQFDDVLEDAQVALSEGATVERLEGALWHHAVTNLDQLLAGANRRSGLGRDAGGRAFSPPFAVLSAAWIFFRCYFLRLGLLEGWRGLLIAVTAATETFFGHMKRYSDGPEDPLAKLSRNNSRLSR